MNKPWMPLYIADYLADTAHLTAAQSGAYLHLIMHYWQTGNLPEDDLSLARIARMTAVEWKRHRETVAGFFHDGWRHKRIDAELAHAEEVSSKRRASAQQKHSKRTAIAPANAEQKDTHARTCAPALQSQPQTQTESKISSPNGEACADSDPERELFERGKRVLGKGAGGLIKNLLKAKGGNIALARAAIEQASTKQDPREYIGAITRNGRAPPSGPNDLWDGAL